MLSESSKAYNYIKNCICVINIIWYVDELSVDVIEDECQILQRLKDFMLSLTSKFHEDHNTLKVANIYNCSQYVFFFSEDVKWIFNFCSILSIWTFFIIIQLQNKVIADKICFPVYDYIIGLQQV